MADGILKKCEVRARSAEEKGGKDAEERSLQDELQDEQQDEDGEDGTVTT